MILIGKQIFEQPMVLTILQIRQAQKNGKNLSHFFTLKKKCSSVIQRNGSGILGTDNDQYVTAFPALNFIWIFVQSR